MDAFPFISQQRHNNVNSKYLQTCATNQSSYHCPLSQSFFFVSKHGTALYSQYKNFTEGGVICRLRV